MPRRTSRSLVFFLVILFIIAVGFIAYRSQTSKRSQNSPSGTMSTSHQPSEPDVGRRHRHERPSRTFPPEVEESCSSLGVSCGSTYFKTWQEPSDGECAPSIRNGYPVPDPRCTPGGINSTVSAKVLTDPQWRTRCIRNCESSESLKHITYRWYGIAPHHPNSGSNQVCELDHLVPLELGGADGLGNIWPQCGPDGATLNERYFKAKDRVENYLAGEVKAGRMSLNDAQKGIASDWTQYLTTAHRN